MVSVPRLTTSLKAEIEEMRGEILARPETNTLKDQKGGKGGPSGTQPGNGGVARYVKGSPTAKPPSASGTQGSRVRGTVLPQTPIHAQPSPGTGGQKPTKLEEQRLNKKIGVPVPVPIVTPVQGFSQTLQVRPELGMVDITMSDHPMARTLHSASAIGGISSDHYFEEFGANGMVVVNEAGLTSPQTTHHGQEANPHDSHNLLRRNLSNATHPQEAVNDFVEPRAPEGDKNSLALVGWW